MTNLSIENMPGLQTIKVSMDLNDYVYSYFIYKSMLAQNADAALLDRAKETVLVHRNSMAKHFTSIAKALLWDKIFDHMTQYESLSEHSSPSLQIQQRLKTLEDIKQSAAYTILTDSFPEILMNVIDARMSQYLSQREFVSRPPATLYVSMDDFSHSDYVTFLFKDNCGGFPDHIVNLKTEEALRAYVRATGSEKRAQKAKDPLFLGSYGLGLRLLIAKIYEGADIDPTNDKLCHLYMPPQGAIEFENFFDEQGRKQGALLTITTEKAPLQLKKSLEYDTMTEEGTEDAMTVVDDEYITTSESILSDATHSPKQSSRLSLSWFQSRPSSSSAPGVSSLSLDFENDDDTGHEIDEEYANLSPFAKRSSPSKK